MVKSLASVLLLITAVGGASICDGRGCKPGSIQEQEQLFIFGDEPNEDEYEILADLEVEPPVNERDSSLDANSKIVPWPNGTVPYAIWGSDKTKEMVLNSLKKIEENSCVSFVPREGEARYLLIKEGDGGCWTSSMGFPSTYKKVTINLGLGCKHGKHIKHEVYHALGFPHEHSRPDRSDHVTIKWDNIKDGSSSQFSIMENFPTLDVPYDLKSIMHYGKHDFAKDQSKPTIVPTPWVEGPLGGDSLSYRDIRKLNFFYNCEEYLDEV